MNCNEHQMQKAIQLLVQHYVNVFDEDIYLIDNNMLMQQQYQLKTNQ